MSNARCNRTPLTDAQRALAGDPRNLRYARRWACRFRRQWPWLAEDIDSAALEGLVKAARVYDPDRGLAFATLLQHAVVGRVKDYLRDFVVPKGYRKREYGTAPRFSRWSVYAGEHRDDEVVPSGEGPVGWEADALAGLDELTKGLPPRHRRVLRSYYGRAGATMKQIGAEMGVSEGRLSQMHAEAIAMLREKFVGGEGPADGGNGIRPAIDGDKFARLEAAMRECGGNKVAAARRLGVSLKTVYNWIECYVTQEACR